jgi:hypothetical protein
VTRREPELRLSATEARQGSARALTHVLWIGGPPGSGKTAIATRLARRHGLRWYNADTQTWAHRDRAIAEGHRGAVRWEAMSPEERWVTSSPDEMLALSLHAERGAMIVDDLRSLPDSPLVVAEGSPVSPAIVSSGIAERTRTVWLVPTADVLRRRLDVRNLPPGPYRLYLLLAATIEREAREHDAPTLTVDGSLGIDETVSAVEERFAAALAAGPRAESLHERRALIREANAAHAAQVRAGYARRWANGDAESVVRTFVCECGDPACDVDVELAVGDFPAGPVLADGHG